MADEPPFFLSQQQSYFPNNFVSSGSDRVFGPEAVDDSENEDLRGVIDDLTVENKRLKQLLKDHRPRSSPTSEAAQTDKERLFELRVHGLGAEKKRELEALLRNFATSVNNSSHSLDSSSATYGTAVQASHSEGTSSSNAPQPPNPAKLLQTDSGYGSNSNSGITSAAVSHGGKQPYPVSKTSRDKSIKNYLHDIPDTLLPRQQSLFMSERAKMALVVRRLEQLFTGKNAAPGEHSQPIQQQEVSHSAAQADVQPGTTRGAEGTREAHMLPYDTKVNLDALDRQEPSPPPKPRKTKVDNPPAIIGENIMSGPGTPDQRPTRPLDLDIHRAQVAAENIEYIRHLGLSSPQINSQNNERPWMYLNLLTSMAQLHTINVTPAFIRRAIKRLSTKFELSSDGHRVRWTGGTEGTIFSKEEERAMEASNQDTVETQDESGHGSSKRSKTESSSNAVISEEPSSEDKSGLQTSDGSKQKLSTEATSYLPTSLPTAQSKTGSAFDYKPMFYKGKKYSAHESYLESTDSSMSNSGDSSGLAQALSRSNLNHGRDEGMITFFNNPFFCSDASADHAPVNWKPQREVVSWATLGVEHDFDQESPLRHHDACYFTPQFARKPETGSSKDPILTMPVTRIQAAGESETQPLELPASGLGGISPEDNFALDVKIARVSRNPKSDAFPATVPFTGSRKRKRYAYKGLSCEMLELRPSKLPPPSYIFFTTDSSSGHADTMEDSDGSESSSSADEEYPAPPAFLNHWSTGSSDVESDGPGYEDSSMDMLEMARAADPDRIAAQEREYMMNRPGLGNVVEGSLAATVGASRSSVAGSDIAVDSDESVSGSRNGDDYDDESDGDMEMDE